MLRRTLERRITTWARRAEREGQNADDVALQAAASRSEIDSILSRLGEVGLVNDVAFAEARARGLSRSGRSRRAIHAHLTSKGVEPETVRAALPSDPDDELDAALALAKKRRLGPYAREGSERPKDAKGRLRELAVFGRAGFERGTAERALRMDREDAEARWIARHK
jgi:regulatory protein